MQFKSKFTRNDTENRNQADSYVTYSVGSAFRSRSAPGYPDFFVVFSQFLKNMGTIY
jgi:hypothetical protein